MIIEEEKYVVATKTYPIMFDDGCGNAVSKLKYARMWELESQAKENLALTDEDVIDDWQVVKVKITYEF